MGFMAAMKERCNAGVEQAYWVKTGSNAQPGDRLTSAVEEMLIGYHNNEPTPPNTKRVSEFFNFQKINHLDPMEPPRSLNYFEFEKVTKLFHPTCGGKGALNADQKPIALIQHIYHILNGKPADTVLDLGCGSASASHAALLLGMNAMAIDHDPVQTRGALERLFNIDKVHGRDVECGFQDPAQAALAAQKEALKEEQRRRKEEGARGGAKKQRRVGEEGNSVEDLIDDAAVEDAQVEDAEQDEEMNDEDDTNAAETEGEGDQDDAAADDEVDEGDVDEDADEQGQDGDDGNEDADGAEADDAAGESPAASSDGRRTMTRRRARA